MPAQAGIQESGHNDTRIHTLTDIQAAAHRDAQLSIRRNASEAAVASLLDPGLRRRDVWRGFKLTH